jgi:predicted exporter
VTRWLPLVATLGLLLGALTLTFRAAPPGGDMADFLPRSDRAEARFLLGELQTGAATTLLLAGIEGAEPGELARLSRAVGDALRTSGNFAFVANGTQDVSEAEREQLFAYRYLLSPLTEPAIFTAPALRTKLEALLDGLGSSAAPLLRQFGFADPPGAFIALARGLIGTSSVTLREGVWFAGGEAGPRALLLARSRANGLDPVGQQTAADTIRAAFAAATPGSARLLLSGPGVFAAEAARAIRGDVEMISILSAVLIAALLLWRTRSFTMLALVGVPLAAGTLAGFLAVVAIFGSVHGAAFGFGMTMLGVAVDYPILLLTQRQGTEALAATARRIWPTLRLAALAAIIGMVAMLGAGFSGLQQLAVFAAAGLLVSALVTRYVLPRLAQPFGIGARPLPGAVVALLRAMPRARIGALALIVATAFGLLAMGGPPVERDISALSPVPEAPRRLDAELRAALGAPDVGTFIVLPAADAEAALQASERAARALAPLLADGRLAGLDHPARYVPSATTQRARQAMLPGDATLREALDTARAGLPFRATAFDPFLEGVARSRTLPPLSATDLAPGSALAARIAPLLAPDAAGWHALMLPAGLTDPDALRAALAGETGALVIDLRAELSTLLGDASLRAALAAALGAALVLAMLVIGLGSVRAGLHAALPIAGALLLTIASLALLGERLNLFHLAACLLLAGIALDYSLFLRRLDASTPTAEAARTLAAVLTCMLATLLTFGLLAVCTTPVLRSIGLTVAVGVVYAFLLAATLAPRSARTT